MARNVKIKFFFQRAGFFHRAVFVFCFFRVQFFFLQCKRMKSILLFLFCFFTGTISWMYIHLFFIYDHIYVLYTRMGCVKILLQLMILLLLHFWQENWDSGKLTIKEAVAIDSHFCLILEIICFLAEFHFIKLQIGTLLKISAFLNICVILRNSVFSKENVIF